MYGRFVCMFIVYYIGYIHSMHLYNDLCYVCYTTVFICTFHKGCRLYCYLHWTLLVIITFLQLATNICIIYKTLTMCIHPYITIICYILFLLIEIELSDLKKSTACIYNVCIWIFCSGLMIYLINISSVFLPHFGEQVSCLCCYMLGCWPVWCVYHSAISGPNITCSVSYLSEDNTGWCFYAYLLLLHESKSECVFTCVCEYIYSDSEL